MVHFRILGCFWFLAGTVLCIASLYYDWPRMQDRDFALAIEHWAVGATLLAIGTGLFRAATWARVSMAVLLLPLALLCFMLFLMLGVTRSGHAYFVACLPFIIVFLVLPYNVLVLVLVRPKKHQSL